MLIFFFPQTFCILQIPIIQLKMFLEMFLFYVKKWKALQNYAY